MVTSCLWNCPKLFSVEIPIQIFLFLSFSRSFFVAQQGIWMWIRYRRRYVDIFEWLFIILYYIPWFWFRWFQGEPRMKINTERNERKKRNHQKCCSKLVCNGDFVCVQSSHWIISISSEFSSSDIRYMYIVLYIPFIFMKWEFVGSKTLEYVGKFNV